MKKLILPFCAAIVLLQACSKSGNSNNTNPSGTPTIVGKWLIVYEMADKKIPFNDTVIQDYWSLVPACMKDDYFIFNSDNSLEYHQGNNVCDSTLPLVSYETWGKTGNTLAITNGSKITIATVIKLNNDTLQIQEPEYTFDKNFDTVKYNQIETFKRL